MSRSAIFERGAAFYRAIMVLALLFAGMPTASAATREISAVFRPDPAKPMDNKFVNTTPLSGYCFYYPERCAAANMFSLNIPLAFQSSSAIQANHSDSRQGAMLKVPANWRTMQVIHSGTGEIEEVSVRIVGLGGSYILSESAIDLVGGGVNIVRAHDMLWEGRHWGSAPQPCQSTSVGGYGGQVRYEFFWMTPQEAACAKQAKYLIPGLRYAYMSFAYELRTPNPLKMSAGHYTGAINYTVGPGQDFDMGDVLLPDDPSLTLNFNLEVQHTLKVEVPPGGNKIVLEPQGGWQAWLNQGQKPTRLFRDQTFHLWASSRFKMRLECQFADAGDNTCLLWAPSSGYLIPVDISVTLPNGLTDAAGQPVNRRRLYLDGSGTELFQPGHYVDRKPGTLHFEVGRSQVEEMLAGEAKHYSGNVTVIWDSEV
ncbi:hypothetical protein J2W43_003027 [Pseudomonas brassicacearum]|uniref:Uncharacterized protein n=1 Tax=Pseudomonas brassicacearum TaxID=930166 RepID=A0AAW8MBF8_9PSED|nr:hypothetical protein [Pseudomonas brassicacearum]